VSLPLSETNSVPEHQEAEVTGMDRREQGRKHDAADVNRKEKNSRQHPARGKFGGTGHSSPSRGKKKGKVSNEKAKASGYA